MSKTLQPWLSKQPDFMLNIISAAFSLAKAICWEVNTILVFYKPVDSLVSGQTQWQLQIKFLNVQNMWRSFLPRVLTLSCTLFLWTINFLHAKLFYLPTPKCYSLTEAPYYILKSASIIFNPSQARARHYRNKPPSWLSQGHHNSPKYKEPQIETSIFEWLNTLSCLYFTSVKSLVQMTHKSLCLLHLTSSQRTDILLLVNRILIFI